MKDAAYDIFISYSSDVEGRLVDEMIKYFEDHHRMKAFDWLRDSYTFGDPLTSTLENRIKECSVVFMLVSSKSLESPWVQYEIACARQHNKRLIPVYSDRIDQTRFPKELRGVLGIEYRSIGSVRSQLAEIAKGENGWGCIAYIPAGGFGTVEFCVETPKAFCPIGDRPMLFHVIDSLAGASLFRKAVVINHMSHAPDFIRYITSLKYPSSGDSAHSGHDREGFKGKVECVETEAERWPQALKEQSPKDTFVLQLCDVILSFDQHAKTISMIALEKEWEGAFKKHNEWKRAWGDGFLGTLLTCDYYRLSAGIIKVKRGNEGEIDKVTENPETPTPLNMNTGTAILEPGILNFIEDGDTSLLEGAVTRALENNKRFVEYKWKHWSHVLNVIDRRLLHDKRVKILQEERGVAGQTVP